MARHPSRRAPGLAERQRLPASRPQTTDAFISRLLQEHLQNPHRDGEHLDTPARYAAHTLIPTSICDPNINVLFEENALKNNALTAQSIIRTEIETFSQCIL